MSATLLTTGLLWVAACAICADAEPRELEELEQAKQTYEVAIEKARAKLVDGIEKQIVAFAKSGKLNVVTALQTDRDRFKANYALPESTYVKGQRTTYERELKTATTTLSRAYERAIVALTKRLETEQAQALKNELEELTARQATSPKFATIAASIEWQPTDLQVTEGHFYRIQAKGVWRGTNGVQCGPDGALSKPYEQAMHEMLHHQNREKYLTIHPISSLICRIGDETWNFFAGTECRFLAPRSGKLSFCMNDAKQKSDGRQGSLEVSMNEIKNHKWLDDSGGVRVTGLVDTVDELIMTAEGVRWRHPGGWDRVGVQGGVSPTVINGVYWFPQWPNWPNDRTTSALKTPEFAPSPKRTISDFKYTGSNPGVVASVAKATSDEIILHVEKGSGNGAGVVTMSWRYAKP